MDAPTANSARKTGPDPTWAAFLAMAFVVVGLAGLFASYAVPLPLQRALARDAALDAALATPHAADPAAALAALRDELGDSADALLAPGGDLVARVGAERAAMRVRLRAEADAVARRTRWLLGIVTLMGATFGVAILHIGRRG